MAAFVGKMVAKKVFQEKASNGQGTQDPYFEKVPATKMGVNYTKKQRKPLHPDLTPKEVQILTKAKRRAYRLDMALFSIPGIGRFGWSSVIGLIPAIGDVLDGLLACMLIRTCCSVEPELPSSVKMTMWRNLAFDFVIGLVPFLGDIADAMYKCNTKNVILLEGELVKRAEKRRRDAGKAPIPGAGPDTVQDYEAFDNEYEMSAPSGPPPRYTSTKKPRRPEQAHDPQRPEGRGGFFGGRNEVDLEAGEGGPGQLPTLQGSGSRDNGRRSDRR